MEEVHGTTYLLNTVPISGIIMPNNLKNKITILSTCLLSENCVNLFNNALKAVSKQIESENMNESKLIQTNVVFTHDGLAVFQMEAITLGFHMDLCLYNLNALYNDKDNDEILITGCFVEELAHHFWFIDDEIEVKHKVFEILKQIGRAHV